MRLGAVKALDNMNRVQCLKDLKATGLRLCLMRTCGPPRLKIKRIIQGL